MYITVCDFRFALAKNTLKRRVADNQLSAFHILLIQSLLDGFSRLILCRPPSVINFRQNSPHHSFMQPAPPTAASG